MYNIRIYPPQSSCSSFLFLSEQKILLLIDIVYIWKMFDLVSQKAIMVKMSIQLVC